MRKVIRERGNNYKERSEEGIKHEDKCSLFV